MNMNFEQASGLGVLKIFGEKQNFVSSITYDSRKVVDHSCFVCITGEKDDGHLYIGDALNQGATVFIGDNEKVLEEASLENPELTFLYVKNVRVAVARLAAFFHDYRYKNLLTVGITGTNGKTTVATYVKSLLNNLRMPTGSIGTMGVYSSKRKLNFSQNTPTTPESTDIHDIIDQLYACGDKAVAMEVSSIALEQKRVEGMLFDIGVHTNLSEEHIEYHKNFLNYKQAKLKLFEQVKKAVINVDDSGMATDIMEMFKGNAFTYSLSSHSKADVIATNIRVDENGSVIDLEILGEVFYVRTSVCGDYNVANLLAAVCVALHAGFPVKKIVRALSHIENPEGRFELIQVDTFGRKVILDYAHTPIALKSLIAEVKKLKHNRLIVMIAGVGIRDLNKMPKMASAVDGIADSVVVTVDHPGYMEPAKIVDHVLDGLGDRDGENIYPTYTREEGVKQALSIGGQGDIILLTGGCINGAQIVRGEKVTHSDAVIIKEYFEEMQQKGDRELQKDI